MQAKHEEVLRSLQHQAASLLKHFRNADVRHGAPLGPQTGKSKADSQRWGRSGGEVLQPCCVLLH